MKRKTHRCCQPGFTLIELMVTIAVAAVLMVVAAPSFVTYQRNAELTSLTNTLMASINAARGEAMKRGMFAMVLPKDGSQWKSGWIVFIDRDLSKDFDATKDEIVQEQPAAPSYIDITGTGIASGSSPYVLYNGSGYAKDKSNAFGALTISIKRNDVPAAEVNDQTRRIIIAATGRTRSCRPSQDTSCSATATE